MSSTRTRALTVEQIMTSNPVTVGPGDTLVEVARMLDANEISGLPVIDVTNCVIGVVSKTDVLHRAVEGPLGSRPASFFESIAEGLGRGSDLDPEELGVVEEFMSTEFLSVSPDDSVSSVARRMSDMGYHRAIVVDADRRLLGIVTSLDILRVFPR